MIPLYCWGPKPRLTRSVSDAVKFKLILILLRPLYNLLHFVCSWSELWQKVSDWRVTKAENLTHNAAEPILSSCLVGNFELFFFFFVHQLTRRLTRPGSENSQYFFFFKDDPPQKLQVILPLYSVMIIWMQEWKMKENSLKWIFSPRAQRVLLFAGLSWWQTILFFL